MKLRKLGIVSALSLLLVAVAAPAQQVIQRPTPLPAFGEQPSAAAAKRSATCLKVRSIGAWANGASGHKKPVERLAAKPSGRLE